MIDHISPSQVDTFYRCSEAWRRRYIEGHKIPPAIAMCVGSGTHGAAEYNFKAKIVDKIDRPLDDCIDAAVTEYNSRISSGVFLTREEATRPGQTMGEAKDQMVSMVSTWHGEIAPIVNPLLVEQRMHVQPEDLSVPLLGYIDVIDEDWTIRDLKTSKSRWQQKKAERETQPTIYTKMVQLQAGKDNIPFAYDILVKNKKPTTQTIYTTRDQSDWNAIVLKIENMLRQIKAGNFGPASSDSWMCNPDFCGYFSSCKYISVRLKTLPRVQ